MGELHQRPSPFRIRLRWVYCVVWYRINCLHRLSLTDPAGSVRVGRSRDGQAVVAGPTQGLCPTACSVQKSTDHPPELSCLIPCAQWSDRTVNSQDSACLNAVQTKCHCEPGFISRQRKAQRIVRTVRLSAEGAAGSIKTGRPVYCNCTTKCVGTCLITDTASGEPIRTKRQLTRIDRAVLGSSSILTVATTIRSRPRSAIVLRTTESWVQRYWVPRSR
ncbi:hypothetical protein CLV58_1414 [Spirosoma oryzae]|uniref:Uncharacterized protein n=1 Tax=Spirosoma oryzae TaxID=1469603 RepID=A0A2T0RQW4_9BACT|nr:hypothetical protein CLV58_1414 [Spirosoma oryzae]